MQICVRCPALLLTSVYTAAHTLSDRPGPGKHLECGIAVVHGQGIVCKELAQQLHCLLPLGCMPYVGADLLQCGKHSRLSLS